MTLLKPIYEGPMELFGSYTSPFVRHCRIALAETGLDYDFVKTDMLGSAKKSPTQKVPFLRVDDLALSDSSSILKYIREKANQPFLQDIRDYDQFCLINTLMDSAINLFILEKNNLTPENTGYLKRQQQRIASGLNALENTTLSQSTPYTDSELRLGCFLAWGLFRQRFTLDSYPKLTQFLANMESYAPFRDTPPTE